MEKERKQTWKPLGSLGEMYIGILCTRFAIFCESKITGIS